MPNKNLETLFHDTLKDIYFAERKILKGLDKMIKNAQTPELKKSFEDHHSETEEQIERLERVFGMIDKRPQGKTCEAIQGILEEGEEIMQDYKGSPALEAGMVSAAQAVEHYEIARYGTLKCWAEMLDMPEAAKLLDQNLQEELAADKKLTQFAEKSANPAAIKKAA
ncbi:MAG: ferritin-like domain-containing protein [Alphaproteobacteria bacterium]|nr:ferritin-like domain-containing protein [Alphaproteobacteria bacterium]MBU0859976.1 ferritin-like domain-containing protein [Alphaproteobacteria bacterium]